MERLAEIIAGLSLFAIGVYLVATSGSAATDLITTAFNGLTTTTGELQGRGAGSGISA